MPPPPANHFDRRIQTSLFRANKVSWTKEVPYLTLTFSVMTQNQCGSCPNNLKHVYEVSKKSDILCSLYRAHNGINVEHQGWPWPLTMLSNVNRIPPLIINNPFVQFKYDRTKTEVGIIPTIFHRQSIKDDLDLWPKFNRIPPLMVVNFYMKFECD